MIYVVLLLASFSAAFISGAAGFGGALLLLPVVTASVGVEVAVPVLTIAQLIGNLSRMAFGWKQIAWKPVALFCATALPLSVLGAFGFSVLPKDIVTQFIGAILIALVLFKVIRKVEFKTSNKLILVGGAVTGLLSGLAGSAGPIGAAIFLSLGLSPVAYVASEASTATAMHILKTVIYSRLVNVGNFAVLIGLGMGVAMILGTYAANNIIKNMEKGKFQKYVAALFCVVGVYMLISGA